MSRNSPDRQDLKVGFRELVKAVGGFDAAAGFSRIGKSQLHRCTMNEGDDFAPVDVVGDLEAITVDLPGWPHVTRRLCTRAGGVFLRLPPAMPDAGCWHGGMGALAKEAGEITTAICTALADDGRIDADEARTIIAECEQAAAALMAVKQMAQAIIPHGGGAQSAGVGRDDQ